MPNFILTKSSVMICPHGAPVMHVPLTNQRGILNGELLLYPDDHYTIAGCPFSTSQGPSPCHRVIWTNPSKNFMIGGKRVLTSASIGIVQTSSGSAQGGANILSHQTVATD